MAIVTKPTLYSPTGNAPTGDVRSLALYVTQELQKVQNSIQMLQKQITEMRTNCPTC